jgi:ribonuclease D
MEYMDADSVIKRPGFERRMTREEINACPIIRNESPIHVVSSRGEISRAVERLSKERILGFDTETKPAFKKGQSFPPSLLQLAGHRSIYIFQLRHLKFPRILRAILSSPHIIKAGVAPDHDIAKLKELGSFKQSRFVDLSVIARKAGIKNHGLRGMAAVLLGHRISKKAQRSNWARETLTPAQVKYAATDAWVSRELYLKLVKKGFRKLIESHL